MYAVNLTVYFRNVYCPSEAKVPRGHSIVAAAGVQQLRPTPTHCLLGLHNTLLANRHYGYTLWVCLVQNALVRACFSAVRTAVRAAVRAAVRSAVCISVLAKAPALPARHPSESNPASLDPVAALDATLGLYRPPGLLERSSRHWNRCAFLCWEGNICGCVFYFPLLLCGVSPVARVCVWGVFHVCMCFYFFAGSSGAGSSLRLCPRGMVF